MERLHLDELFEEETGNDLHNNAFRGLVILSKYGPGLEIITGASHDEIFSLDIDEVLTNGLTKEDALELRALNWGLNHEFNCFCCFV